MQGERTSDQTPAGYNEVEKVGVIRTLYKIGEGMAEGVPLPDTEVAASRESMGAKWGARSHEPRVSSRGALKVLSIAWIFGLYLLSLPLLCLTPGALAPLLRARSISPVTLELFGKKGTGRAGLINAPSQILERHPHGFVETVHIPSLDYRLQLLTYIEAVFRQLDGIFIVNHLVLVWLSMRDHEWAQNGGTNSNQSEGGASSSENLLRGGSFDCIPIQNIDPVVQERRLGLAGPRCHFRWLGARRTGGGGVEFK